MAQHVQIDTIDNEKIKQIATSIRGYRYFATSMKFQEIYEDEYKETLRDRVFVTHRNVSQSLVHGGKASFEVHTTPAQSDNGRLVTNIYLVA